MTRRTGWGPRAVPSDYDSNQGRFAPRYHLLPEPLAFTTGTSPELLIVDPILTAALLVLAGWAADPRFVTRHWHELAG
jgi:hypothetical protein